MRHCYLYRHFDASEKLLYIGISVALGERTRTHSEHEFFNRVVKITVEHFDSVEGALAAERRAIQLEGPELNVVHNRGFRAADWTVIHDKLEEYLLYHSDRSVRTTSKPRISEDVLEYWTGYDRRWWGRYKRFIDFKEENLRGISALRLMNFCRKKAGLESITIEQFLQKYCTWGARERSENWCKRKSA